MSNSKDCQNRPAHRTIKGVAAVIGLFVATGAIASMNTSTLTTQTSNGGMCTANLDQSSTIEVICTDTTPYSIGLAAGTDTGTVTVTVTY